MTDPQTAPSRERRDTAAESSRALLSLARRGDSRAMSRLFRRQGEHLRRWARGRLPGWARNMADTADIVQDALLQTFRRIESVETNGQGALRAYLRAAVQNRIKDELRRTVRRPLTEVFVDDAHDTAAALTPSPYDTAESNEQDRRYRAALARLNERERMLIVARLEMNYSYEQLALVGGHATPGAARVFVRRAMLRLAEVMGDV